MNHPKMFSVYANCFKLKAILAPGSGETSVPALNCLEEFKLETLPIRDCQI